MYEKELVSDESYTKMTTSARASFFELRRTSLS